MDIPFDELWTPDDAAKHLTGDYDLARNITAAILAGKLAAERREYTNTPGTRPPWEMSLYSALGFTPAKTEPTTVYEYELNPFDAVAWAISAGVDIRPECLTLYRELAKPDRHDHEAEPSAIAAVPTVKPPPPLPTPAVATCFSDLHGWNREQWLQNLGDPAQWMKKAITQHRKKPEPHLWDPVKLANALLVRDKSVPPKEITWRFTTRPELEPWRDAWQPYAEAYELPTD